jgi:hypothetical protein
VPVCNPFGGGAGLHRPARDLGCEAEQVGESPDGAVPVCNPFGGGAGLHRLARDLGCEAERVGESPDGAVPVCNPFGGGAGLHRLARDLGCGAEQVGESPDGAVPVCNPFGGGAGLYPRHARAWQSQSLPLASTASPALVACSLQRAVLAGTVHSRTSFCPCTHAPVVSAAQMVWPRLPAQVLAIQTSAAQASRPSA